MTINETERSILALAINSSDKECQLSDNYSNATLNDMVTELGLTANQMAGYTSDLMTKGLITIESLAQATFRETEGGMRYARVGRHNCMFWLTEKAIGIYFK